ncbi:SMC-Scp complex subunit ScpB [Mollicutes bacterium LVI A0078]|nr:SMC-Scp complex subunit ScpB [Mollicutes bacterium LVI A0075]WOO90761.1 SMC-Scp complex subunit ScpB [Mollicutes bacterium LVI A0078]
MTNNKPIIEGLLFLSGDKGLTLGELVTYIGLDPLSIEKIVAEMNQKYKADQDSAFTIVYTAQSYKIATKPQFADKFEAYANSEYNDVIPKSSLETLAIICYNQPITKFDIEQIKGVSPSHTVSVLLERNLIEVVGRSDEIGRPKLYAITDTTLDYLGINSIEEMPALKDYKLAFDDESDELFNSEIDFKEIRKRLLTDLEFEQSVLEIEEEEIDVPEVKLFEQEMETEGE